MLRTLFLLPTALLLAACKGPAGAPFVQPRLYDITEKTATTLPESRTSREMDELIAPYKTQLDARMNRQLAVIVTPLVKASPEGNLGNWMADVIAAAARNLYPERNIAFAATNPGGLRLQEIGTGPLLVSEVYELMPFDNKVVVVDLSGAETRAFIAHMANSGGWPVSEELAVDLTTGSLHVTVDGQPLDDDARYQVATIDYVANGGSRTTMLKGKPQTDSGRFLRDLLIEYAQKTPEIDVRAKGERMKL